MSWKIIERYRRLLATEEGTIVKGWGGKITVCLVYPNNYRTGMSNLGFQAVYSLLNSQPDVVCERAFLPENVDLSEYRSSRTPLLSLESQRPLGDFDLVAFSVSFETDYLNIPRILALARIPSYSEERSSNFPFIIAGGAALFLNPEPVADFFDLVCVGEGEMIITPLLDLLRSTGGVERDMLLAEAARLDGFYVPSLYNVDYSGDSVKAITPIGDAPTFVKRVWSDDLDETPVGSELFSSETEFSEMYLLELSRGCPRGCRFCAASFIYEPYRQRSLDSVREQACKALVRHRKIGLVGAAVGDFHGIGALCSSIRSSGGDVSVASLRIDALDEEMIRVLVESGHKTVSLAPEGPSQRLRDLVRKGISTEQILAACERLISRDILNLKLYFIIGLPTETQADLEEMVGLIEEIRKLVTTTAKDNRRLGKLILSVNPFIPKPFTPFQWCGMAPARELEVKMSFLLKSFSSMSNVKLQMEGVKEATLQALLARGDRRLSQMLVSAAESGNWRRAIKECGLDLERLVTRTIPLTEVLPWDVIYCGNRERLEGEYRKAFD